MSDSAVTALADKVIDGPKRIVAPGAAEALSTNRQMT